MAYAFVQQVSNITGAGQAITPSATNAMVGCFVTNNQAATAATTTDTAGNTWTTSTPIAISTSNYLFFFYALNVAGTATTVTCAPNGGSASGLYIAEYSGLTSFVNSSHNSQNPNSTATDAITTTNVNATSVPAASIGFVIDANNNPAAVAAGTGYTARTSVWSVIGDVLYPEDKRVTSSGNNSATWTAQSGFQFDLFVSVQMVFAETSGPPPGIPLLGQILM